MAVDVLIVDDDEDFGLYVKDVSEGLGLRPRCLTDPLRFHEDYAQLRPALVVLDIGMEPLDGMQLAQWMGEVARDEQFSSSLVLLSGQSADQIRLCSTIASLSGLTKVVALSKPVEVHVLENVLRNLAEACNIRIRPTVA